MFEFITKAFKNKKDPTQDLFSALTYNLAGSPPARTATELLAAYNTNPWLRAVTSRIAYHIGTARWFVGRASSTARAREISRCSDPVLFRELIAQEKIIPDHPLVDLLNNPHPQYSGFALFRLTQLYLDMKGEAFWLLKRGGNGKPNQIWIIPPTWVDQVPSFGEPDGAYKITNATNGASIEWPTQDVLWIRDPEITDPYGRSKGLGDALADEIESDSYASKFIKTFFFNRARMDLLIAIEGADATALRKAKAEFENEYLGYAKASRSHWHSGKMTVKELQGKFTDLQMLQLRQAERDAIFGSFGVPPEMFGIIVNSNKSTIGEAKPIFRSEVILPRLELLRLELQRLFVPLFDDRLIIAYDAPVLQSFEDQLAVRKAASWASSIGEWRRFIGLPVREGDMDLHLIPVNMAPMKQETMRTEKLPQDPVVTGGSHGDSEDDDDAA